MKLLYIPLDYHRHTEDDRLFGDFLRAFQAQCEAKIFTTMEEAVAFKPDVIFYQGSLQLSECIYLKRATGARFTLWTGDVRYAPMQYLMDYREVVDIYFLPFKGPMLNNYKFLLGKPCKHIFEPFQDWRFRDPKNMMGGRISFVGNVYDNVPGGDQRIELANFIGHHLPELECYGSIPNVGKEISLGRYMSTITKGPIDNYKVPDLYNDSYIVIAENNWHDVDGYFTPRNLTAMAAGSCCVMKQWPSAEQLFSNWKNCVIYRHKHELLDIITFLKHNPDVRNRIAKEGHKHVKETFTANHWASIYINQL